MDIKTYTSGGQSWSGLYKAGGICAFLYVVIAIAVPGIMYLVNPIVQDMSRGGDVLQLIAESPVSWMILQTTVLGTSFLAIVVFAALYIALKEVNKGFALIGTVIAIVCHILFIAYYPVILGLTHLSKLYMEAAGGEAASIAASADALLAMNNAFNPLYESVFAVSVLILSLVMLKGVFRKVTAYLGIFTAVCGFIALGLFKFIGIGYLWWWVPFMGWFTIAGVRLLKLKR